MVPSPTQVVVAVTLVVVFGTFWYAVGRGRWRAALEDRFLYGIPWGSALTVAIVVAFYLFAQSGLWHWSDPVVFAFVSWSYFYPLGLVTSGIAHGSPAHLVANMAGTLALAPIAEYAWSHYPTSDGTTAATDGGSDPSGDGEAPADGSAGERARSFVERPWIRALVLFPGALLAAALLTSVYSLGPALGFSGAVYAIIGFSLVNYPLASVVGVVVASGLGTIWEALANPIVREGVESGAPAPPSWAGIAFQAHGLGFLLGVFAGLGILYHRSRRPSTGRLFAGVVLVGLVQGLWLVAWPGADDVYTLYRGPGVVVFLAVAALVAVAVGGKRSDSLLTKRKAVIAGLVLLTFLLAIPAVFTSILVVDDGGIAGSQEIEIRDYNVGYGENVTIDRSLVVGPDNQTEGESATRISGVLLTSEDREIWTRAVRADVLEHSGNETVAVGGPGWHETVRAQRIGWNVAGNDTAFVVDLHHDGETTRSFTTEPKTASARIEGYRVAVVPTQDAFEIRVRDGSGVVDTVPVPVASAGTTVGDLRIVTEVDEEGVRHVYMATADSRALIAEEETYS